MYLLLFLQVSHFNSNDAHLQSGHYHAIM